MRFKVLMTFVIFHYYNTGSICHTLDLQSDNEQSTIAHINTSNVDGQLELSTLTILSLEASVSTSDNYISNSSNITFNRNQTNTLAVYSNEIKNLTTKDVLPVEDSAEKGDVEESTNFPFSRTLSIPNDEVNNIANVGSTDTLSLHNIDTRDNSKLEQDIQNIVHSTPAVPVTTNYYYKMPRYRTRKSQRTNYPRTESSSNGYINHANIHQTNSTIKKNGQQDSSGDMLFADEANDDFLFESGETHNKDLFGDILETSYFPIEKVTVSLPRSFLPNKLSHIEANEKEVIHEDLTKNDSIIVQELTTNYPSVEVTGDENENINATDFDELRSSLENTELPVHTILKISEIHNKSINKEKASSSVELTTQTVSLWNITNNSIISPTLDIQSEESKTDFDIAYGSTARSDLDNYVANTQVSNIINTDINIPVEADTVSINKKFEKERSNALSREAGFFNKGTTTEYINIQKTWNKTDQGPITDEMFITTKIFGRKAKFSIEVTIENRIFYVPSDVNVSNVEKNDHYIVSFTWSSNETTTNNMSLNLRKISKQFVIDGVQLGLIKDGIVSVWEKNVAESLRGKVEERLCLEIDTYVKVVFSNVAFLSAEDDEILEDSSDFQTTKYEKKDDTLLYLGIVFGLLILVALVLISYFVIMRILRRGRNDTFIITRL